MEELVSEDVGWVPALPFNSLGLFLLLNGEI